MADREALPDRVWTLPNALSVLRLLGVPLFLWLLLGPEADGWAVVVLMVAGFTDWADGKLARLARTRAAGWAPCSTRPPTGSTSSARWWPWRCATSCPLWIVVLLVGREVVLGVALLVLRQYGYPPLQVHYLGKAATLLLLYAFPGLLLADGDGWLATVARAVRLGAHHLGHGPLRAGRPALPRPGGRHRACRASGPASGTAP